MVVNLLASNLLSKPLAPQVNDNCVNNIIGASFLFERFERSGGLNTGDSAYIESKNKITDAKRVNKKLRAYQMIINITMKMSSLSLSLAKNCFDVSSNVYSYPFFN